MNAMQHKLGAVLAAATLALGFGAARAELPAAQTQGAVSWISGGIGEGAAAEFKAAEHDYRLSIEMSRVAKPKNEYVADVAVTITDMKGTQLLDAKADGPFMLVTLPPGSYRVSGTLDGKTVKSAVVKIGAKGTARASLVFPADTDS